MLATLIDRPFCDEDWLFEIKWDGIRAIVTIDDGAVTAVSRNGLDLLPRFPSLATIAPAFGDPTVVVDGEVVAIDDTGRSSFQRLQGSMQGDVPITLVAFDLLYAGGRDLRAQPLEERKRILESIVDPDAPGVVYSRHVVGDGEALYAGAMKRKLEGIIGKLRASPYRERRTRDWVKIKVTQTQECVIGGYTEPRGSRKGFGALLLGTYEDHKLRYRGDVGTGFDTKTLVALYATLRALETDASPFDGPVPGAAGRAHWVAPKLVAQIRFSEWTADGKLRHPAFLGLREDKRPIECTREVPKKA